MCLSLYSKYDTAKIAEKNMVVYKHIIKTTNSLNEEVYESSYQHTPVKLNELYSSELIKEYNEVFKGLHSFNELNSANHAAMEYKEVVVECIIPKGSRYFIGQFQNVVAYASDQLIYKKILADYTLVKI